MKKNIIIQKAEHKKLVISNQRNHLIQKIAAYEQRKPTFTQLEFYNRIEENKENQRLHYLHAKERSLKLTNRKKMQSQPKETVFQPQPKQLRNNFIIENQRQPKNIQVTQSSIKDNKSQPRKRRCSIISQRSNVNFSAFSEQSWEIYDILIQSFIIQAKSSRFITLKKQNFHQIFLRLLETLADQKWQKDESPMCMLQQTFQKIKSKLNVIKFGLKSAKLTLISNVSQAHYDRHQYESKINEIKESISGLNLQHDQLIDKIFNKKGELQTIQTLLAEKTEQLNQLTQKSNQVSINNASLQKRLTHLKQEVARQQAVLREFKEKVNNLLTYVDTQKDKPILHTVSEAYKQIQSEIYDYATYLQCNSMASSLSWEPKPFRAVQKWVFQQLERVNNFVMAKSENFDDKCQKMKEFITNTTRKFRTKDEQMMKITDYKTECIKKYIKMMQKWLENWQLKQQFLANLRTEFVGQSEEMNQLLASLQQVVASDTSRSKDFPKLVQRVKQTWKKIELNYKYGNSFY